MKEAKIDNFMSRLHSRTEVDTSIVKDQLNMFLSEQYKDITNYMNNAFFLQDRNIFAFLRSSMNQGSKADDGLRKLIYQFLAEYIAQNPQQLADYISQIFRTLKQYFNYERSSRPKQYLLLPLITIIDIYDVKTLIHDKILIPDEMHNHFVHYLKIQKSLDLSEGTKGQIWLLLSTIQGKFGQLINLDRKREVQQMVLKQLTDLVSKNKNFSTMAALLRSYTKSLQEVLLNPEQLKILYKNVSVLILPLTKRYQVPINAMQLLAKRASIFHSYILNQGFKIFQRLISNMNNTNREFNMEVNQTIDQVLKQIVKGITENPQNPQYSNLYYQIMQRSWNMFNDQGSYVIQGSQSQKQKFKYNIITILKILGTISPLVKIYQTPEDLNKFFNRILKKCTKQIDKAFGNYDNIINQSDNQQEQEGLNARKKIHIKFIYYYQKELISFLAALGQIIYNINSLAEEDQNSLLKIVVISIQQYPSFFEKYAPNLIRVFVELFKVLQIKCHSFHHLLKKIISSGFKILLDSKRLKVNTDDEYYLMIKKTIEFWIDLINHQNWSAGTLSTFGNILFQFLQTMIENLDISYKSNLQMQIEENSELLSEQSIGQQKQQNNKKQQQDLAKIFFLSTQTMRMSNLQEYQYMCGLVLVFQGLLNQIVGFNYRSRIFPFFSKVVDRIRVFSKSVPLMKMIRALNNYLVKFSLTQSIEDKKNKNKINQQQLSREQAQNYVSTNQLNQHCIVAKKLYIEILDHHIQKYQEDCLYECLKMLTSFPVEIYFFQNCQILKENLSYIIERCFQLGQQIITLANSSIQCISRIFQSSRAIAEKYLIQCISKMQKFIWFSGESQMELQLESSKKIYLFVSQMKITKESVAKKIMEFLGSIGGLVHLLVDNQNTAGITWNFQDPINLDVLMGASKHSFNLTRLLSRICFLAINGEYNVKRASCEFLHSIILMVIGNSSKNAMTQDMKSKEITANFLDKVLPTILDIASNSSHPSQQLLHTILIQSIRYFAHKREPNSPDISVILKHLLQLYNGSQDMSCLGSKCIAQLVRWHIKSDVNKRKNYNNYPIIKVIIRNIWTLASNRKAKDGLILLLVELLRQIHRQQDLMKQYSLEICNIILNIGRSNQPIQKQFYYLISKFVLSLNKVIKKLIIEDKKDGDQYKKYPTIHVFLSSLYEKNFFAVYSQQRQIAFILWKQIITKYSNILNYDCMKFLRERADRNKIHLFPSLKGPLQNFDNKQNFSKLLSRLIAICDIWRKLAQHDMMNPMSLIQFKDFQYVLVQSYVNFTHYLIFQFKDDSTSERCLTQQIQKNLVIGLKSLPFLFKLFRQKNQQTKRKIMQSFYSSFKTYSQIQQKDPLTKYIKFVFKLLIKPSVIIPNFDSDLLDQIEQDSSNLNEKGKINNQFQFRKIMISFIFESVAQLNNFERVSEGDRYLTKEGIMQNYFKVIQQLYYCNQKNLVKFLISRAQINESDVHGFSSSFIERYQNFKNSSNSYIYQRQIRTLLSTLIAISKCLDKNHPRVVSFVCELVQILRNENQILPYDKKYLIIDTILSFDGYQAVNDFMLKSIIKMDSNFLNFEKLFLKYLVNNYAVFADQLIRKSNEQPKILKIFYFLQAKLSQNNLKIFHETLKVKMPKYLQNTEQTQSQIYRLHFISVGTIRIIEKETQYLNYLFSLIKVGLDSQKNEDIHFLAINLASLILKKLKQNLNQKNYSNHPLKRIFDDNLCVISNYYIPFTLGQLKKDEQIMKAQKYLKAIEGLIILSKDFKYSQRLFIGFKDQNLKGKLKDLHEYVIDQVITKVYSQKDAQEQEFLAEWILNQFGNQDRNNKNNIWVNFRLAIVQKFFAKMVHFTKKNTLIKLFHKYTSMLYNVISQKVSPKNVEDMVTEFQIKKGAFLILEHLYMYLPKPEKNKAQQRIHTGEYHKKIASAVIQIIKNRFDHSGMILMNEYDKKSVNNKKALEYFRNYMCSAYNCLIVIFISTQSNVNLFKKFLFDKGEALWQHLMDPEKVQFDFPMETEFQIMKPIQAISKYQHKNDKNLQKKIASEYMLSSLYVIDEQIIAKQEEKNQVQEIVEQVNQVKDGSMEKVLQIQLEEDYINKHSCMINILRVIDYMHKQYYDGKFPIWMVPIHEELQKQETPLSIRILLTKVVINRPNIFTQAETWGQCLLKYLCKKQSGGNFIHYYYRDVLLSLIKYINNGFKPDPEKISIIVMRLVLCLPHDKNNEIYSSNIDLMEEFMKLVPGIYVDKNVIVKMLSSGSNPAKKKQNPVKQNGKQIQIKRDYQWRMCACIVMKSCLAFKVPILTQEQWKMGRGLNKSQKFYFFIDFIRSKMFKLIQQLIFDNKIKFRIAASGFLGELMRFFNQKNASYLISEDQKTMMTTYMRDFINMIYDREQNRTSKQRLSLVLINIVSRYPMVLSDSKIFMILDTVIVKYKQEERRKIIECAVYYINELLSSQEKLYGYSAELFLTVKGKIQNFINDSFQVYRATMKLIKLFTKPFFLDKKDIFQAIYTVFDIVHQNYSNSDNQGVCIDFFSMVLQLKDYLNSINQQSLKFKPYLHIDLIQNFKDKIKESLISGLGNKFNVIRKMILEHFQQACDKNNPLQDRILELMKEIHIGSHENLWILNSIPLIFSIAKQSSEYNSFIFTHQIQQSLKFYDFDFKKLQLFNSSQPYTPSYSFFTNNLEKNQKNSDNHSQSSFISSLGSNRMAGIIRATQNSYMSQQEQVFTLLASQSEEQMSGNSNLFQSQKIQVQSEQSDQHRRQEQRNYSTLNNIFMNNRRKYSKDTISTDNKNQNPVKFDSKISIVNDKIRFKPKQKQAEATRLFRNKKLGLNNSKRAINKQNKHIHSNYRSYKLGELPNIQISAAVVLQPLVEVCCFDKQLASQFFTVFLCQIIEKNKKFGKDITQWFIDSIKKSNLYDFSFISTLQKCLITICEKSDEMIKINMNQVAIKSNTIDYAIVFTEQNLINFKRQSLDKQKNSIMIQEEETQQFVKSQWCDLIDLYQNISGHAFLPPMLKHITKEGQYDKLLKTLEYKQQGAISDCYRQLQQLLGTSQNSRLSEFLQKQKIDCLALLGEWEPVTEQLYKKQTQHYISSQQGRLLTLSLMNSEKPGKDEILRKIKFPDDRYDYQKAIIALMNFNMDLADYHCNKQIENFCKYFKKATSFDFNSKHGLIENIQKSYQMRQFLTIHKNKTPTTVKVLDVMEKWTKRLPNEMFDSNLTWIQLLQSRILFSNQILMRFTIPKQQIAKVTTDYMIQVVNQMLKKNVYGCAQIITKKALGQMKKSQFFNWDFYEALSNLKLCEFKKKSIINSKSYQIVPRIVLKELTQHRKKDFYSDIKYLSIQNDHMEGFLECCKKAMDCQNKPNIHEMIDKINKIYKNYELIKKSVKNLQKQNTIEANQMEKIQCKIHFNFTLFLQSILEITKGKLQIKEISQQMEKSNLPIKRMTENFILSLIQTISMMNLSGSRGIEKGLVQSNKNIRNNSFNYNYKQKQLNQHKVFQMILKLLKTIQIQKNKVGQIFSEAIIDKKLPIWIFVYFIPQIIKVLDSAELVQHFDDLFHQILQLYPESLVYHFNCLYQKKIDCVTESARQIYEKLHQKLSTNYKFIEALQLLHHPEQRLTQLLKRFTTSNSNRQNQQIIEQLQEFLNIDDKKLGKYNKKFIQQHKPWVRKIINLKKQNKSENIAREQIQKLMKQLDHRNKQSKHQMKDFTKLSDASQFFEQYNSNDWNRIQVPATIYCKFQQPLSWNRIFIQSFDLSVLTLKSLRKPKRITLYGSNQKKYMFLVKGGQDVRLDQRMEQLFNIMNKMMKKNAQCAKKKLQIKRFDVIPIKKMLGIFGWVQDSQTLKQVLQRQLQQQTRQNVNLNDNNPAFKEYSQKLRSLTRGNARDNTSLYRQLLCLPQEQIVSNLKNCQKYMPFGLLRKTLLRLSKSYDFYLHIKNQFLSNYAVVSVVGYILGIGDRHLQNLLIHAPTASIILIDFGYSFGAGRDLPIPELIPFRLTKCFMEIMQPIGYQGMFKQAMMNTFSALQDNQNVIIDFCDVFIDDPLMQWVQKCKKQNSMVSHIPQHLSMTVSQEPLQKKIYSKRIQFVRKKLLGQHPRKILVEELQQSRHKQAKFMDEVRKSIWKSSKTVMQKRNSLLDANEIAQQLIILASDKNIIGRSYIGLNPYV